MAVIYENRMITPEIGVMVVEAAQESRPGQFYMLRLEQGQDPFLPRPLSVFDYENGKVSFCYRVLGRGTELLSKLRAGDEIGLIGPLGNGFPLEGEKAVLIGGGLGIVPLYYLAKALKERGSQVEVFLGYSGEPFLKEEFESVAKTNINIGGYVTDDVDFSKQATFYTCGPEPMMRVAAKKMQGENPLWVSLESRMACGAGACLGCSRKMKHGNRRICKDGPVFDAREVYYE